VPYHPMSEAEVRIFLTRLPASTGKLATVRADGRPHVTPVWFDVDDDGSVVFNTGADTVKGKNLLREGRAALCVDEALPPFSFVTIEGPVEISQNPDELLAWATRLGGRYMGQDRAADYGRRNAVPGELVVRLRPEHVTSAANLAE
jgi:PPOX class probable F420-dependent enzyme